MNTDKRNEPTRMGASSEAIRRHYDLSDEFFQLWLDPEMIYSCALFDGATDLASAQLRKNRLVGHAGVKNAVGLTLSPSQANWARGRARPGVEVRQESWRDHKPAKPYDAIISIGAFEHFVHPGIDKAAKLDAYRAFFAWCGEALVSGGRLSLQTIAFTAPPDKAIRERMGFIEDSVFPESELPLIWEPIAAAEGRFELVALRNDGDHYYQTLRHWERNLAARHAEAAALVGEAAVENVRRYLRVSAAAFKYRLICLLRMSFAKTA